MTRRSAKPAIRLWGVRQNNLKNFDLELPLGELIVITGLSGSGKSSLAFDTLFAEGQRRYIETFSPYARQFFDRMDKPAVDRIEGIPPAIAIEQRNAVKTTRSTVGTMTELCDYMKLLWPHLAQLHCRQCGRVVRRDAPGAIWTAAREWAREKEVLLTFSVPVSEKLSVADSLGLIAKQGYQRLLVGDKVVRLEEALDVLARKPPKAITVVQDRLRVADSNRARFIEGCEQACHFGKGKLAIYPLGADSRPGRPHRFSSRLHCAECDIEYREPTSALFSFNHPLGACPACRGFGRIITIDYNLAMPDCSKSLAEGVVKPWQTGMSAECQDDLMRMARQRKIPTNVPFADLAPKWKDWLINGDPDYDRDEQHKWPHAWYGVKGYFRWLESKAYKMHVRVLLSRYRTYSTCPECQGRRFQPEALLYRALVRPGEHDSPQITLSDFYQMPIAEALSWVQRIIAHREHGKGKSKSDPVAMALMEAHCRLQYLVDVGLGYLTLDRPTRSLSGGETERVNLTTCLGSRLVNTLYVLDEPTVGLHARDTGRLVRVLENLRTTGNTVVVVEHEPAVMRAADQIVDLGPGQGEKGGQVMYQGPLSGLMRSRESLTGQYLSGARTIEPPKPRLVQTDTPRLALSGVNRHNLKNLEVKIPLGRLVVLTGVSGSGKTTLGREVLLPLLLAKFQSAKQDTTPQPLETAAADDEKTEEEVQACSTSTSITGWENLGRVVLVDQSPLGKTPRSTPAVYTGAFDHIREMFAQADVARQRGLNASAFSFNSAQGQCERCRGAGYEKIEMQFLSDVFIRCPECNGGRYRPHILEVKLRATLDSGVREWSVADFLQATVDDSIEFLMQHFNLPSARRALQSLKLLQEVGLGYLRLGQPINTLSGGESQRLKLVSHLAEFTQAEMENSKPTLFVFDEPTTGLHFEDVRVLLNAFQRLVDGGHSLLVIEHNLEVIKSADWIIDLGPEAGEGGGEVVAQGKPEAVMECAASHTGKALREYFELLKPEPVAVTT